MDLVGEGAPDAGGDGFAGGTAGVAAADGDGRPKHNRKRPVAISGAGQVYRETAPDHPVAPSACNMTMARTVRPNLAG
jgi:hypothetical protein